MCVGRKLNPEDISPALEMFFELMNESSEFHDQRGEPCSNVGDFIRSQVRSFQYNTAILVTSVLRNYTVSRMRKLLCHRCNNEHRSCGKIWTQTPDLCSCVLLPPCWRWSAVLTGLTAWMRSAWAHSAFTRLYLDWTAHSQGSYPDTANRYCCNKIQYKSQLKKW